MKTIFCLLGLLLSTTFVHAQAEIRAKQRAKEVAKNPTNPRPLSAIIADQNKAAAAQSGTAPQAGATAAPFVPPADKITKLTTDLAAIRAKGPATDAQRDQLAADLLASAQGQAKPSTESVNKVAESIAAGLAGKNAAGTEHAQLARHLVTIMNTGVAQPSDVSAANNSAVVVLKLMGVTGAPNEKIAADLQAFIAEKQKGGAQKTVAK